jgi:hypothetical protein
MREQLIELLDDIQQNGNDFKDVEIHGVRYPDTVCNDDVADYLIANGVTIQRWIPVTERLPERGDRVLAYRTHLGKPLVFTAEYFGEWQDVATGSWWYDITHWQPMQLPQKEVQK